MEPLLLMLSTGLIGGLAVGVLLAGGWGVATVRTNPETCAACGYPTESLPQRICPECGNRLAGDGVQPARERRVHRPPIMLQAVCRTVLIAIAAAVSWHVACDKFPRVESWAWLDVPRQSRPFGYRIDASGAATPQNSDIAATPVPRSNTTITITGPSRSLTARVLNTRLHTRWTDASGRVVRTDEMVTPENVRSWLVECGVPTPTQQDSEEIHSQIRQLCAGGQTNLTLPPTQYTANSDTNFVPAVWLAWIIRISTAAMWLWAMFTMKHSGPETPKTA